MKFRDSLECVILLFKSRPVNFTMTISCIIYVICFVVVAASIPTYSARDGQDDETVQLITDPETSYEPISQSIIEETTKEITSDIMITEIEPETEPVTEEETTIEEVATKIPETTSIETTDTEPEPKPEPEEEKYTDKKYTVKNGDNYFKISKMFYGVGGYYRVISLYNNSQSLHTGDVLLIPDKNSKVFNDLWEKIKQDDIEENNRFFKEVAGTTIKAGENSSYTYGNRVNPAVDITVPADGNMKNYTGEVDTSNFTLLGQFTTTGYAIGCWHCNHNTSGYGGSGVKMIPGYSVATGADIPIGTTLYIEGYGFYVVEDRIGGTKVTHNIDISCTSHETCVSVTSNGNKVNVYVVRYPE